jgi:hypothetical protein
MQAFYYINHSDWKKFHYLVHVNSGCVLLIKGLKTASKMAKFKKSRFIFGIGFITVKARQ